MILFLYYLLQYFFPKLFLEKRDFDEDEANNDAENSPLLSNGQSKDAQNNRKICLFIAHPDDEVMFFTPLLNNLNPTEIQNLKIICLTNKSTPRKHELEKCLKILLPDFNASKNNNLQIFDFLDSQDNSKIRREESMIDLLTDMRLVSSVHYLRDLNYHFYTFDSQGVSGHPNHTDCYLYLLSALLTDKINDGRKITTSNEKKIEQIWKDSINRNAERLVKDYKFRLYSLKSVNIIFKYFGVPRFYPSADQTFYNKRGVTDWNKCYLAFLKGHTSQAMWYRHFWFVTSRYLFVSDYFRIY